MNNLDKKDYYTLYEKSQHKILGRVERDGATLRLSVLVAVQIPDGRVSDEVVVQKSKFLKYGIGTLDWLKGYAVVLDEEDLKIIKREIEKLLTEIPKDILETSEKATKEEVFDKLQEFLKDKINEQRKVNEEVKKNRLEFIVPQYFTKNDKVYIKTTEFCTFINENKDFGWSRMEVLKFLKRKGLLETGKGRTYDKKVKFNGVTKNYYVLKMPLDENENLIINEADENIGFQEIL